MGCTLPVHLLRCLPPQLDEAWSICIRHPQTLPSVLEGLHPTRRVVSPPCLLCAAAWGAGWFIGAGDVIELSGNSCFMAVTMTVFKEVH